MKQREIVKHISDEQLQRSLLYTQLLLLSLSAICILFSFPPFYKMKTYFTFDLLEIIVMGGGLVTIALLNDFVLMRFVPEEWLDDGGINERLFKGMSVGKIAIYTMLIAFAEELFFRGVLQSQLGLVISSLIFALVHIRYLEKILLFCSVVVVSFLFGIVFSVTESLVVTMVAHFLIDFILGCYIHFSSDEGSVGENGQKE